MGINCVLITKFVISKQHARGDFSNAKSVYLGSGGGKNAAKKLLERLP